MMLKHPMSMVYQNDERPLSGKFSKTVMAELSILWILQAYMTGL